MAKRLIDIENSIYDRSNSFSQYLSCQFSLEVQKFICVLKLETQVYLFSGIIRNFFIHAEDDFRDLDIIIEDNLDIETLFPDLIVNKNSFGGYKIYIDGVTVDLWIISNTWGLRYLDEGQLKLPFVYLSNLPKTTFFNFSSIVFSLNKNEFTVGKPFLRFLRDKKIDIVLKSNPFPVLCIINSFYYSEKYKLKLSQRLQEYIVSSYNISFELYRNVQIKHFGYELFSTSDLLERINALKNSLIPTKNNKY